MQGKIIMPDIPKYQDNRRHISYFLVLFFHSLPQNFKTVSVYCSHPPSPLVGEGKGEGLYLRTCYGYRSCPLIVPLILTASLLSTTLLLAPITARIEPVPERLDGFLWRLNLHNLALLYSPFEQGG